MTETATAIRSFAIDKTHSEVLFQVRHLVTKVRGRFTDFSGTVHFDPVRPDRSSIEFSINAASVDTATPDRDAHLRSDDFFAVAQFPAITFVSSSVSRKSEERFDVTGTLTIRGQERPVRLESRDVVGRCRHAASAATFRGDTGCPATTTRVQA